MPSSYALVQTTDEAQVLIAQKRILNAWWGGALQAQPTYLNQAGQWVLPGGARQPNETVIGAATREFREETGVDLGGLGLPYQGYSFGSLFTLVVFSFGDVNSLAGLGNLINQNIQPRPGNNSAPTSNLVLDFELEQAQVLPTAVVPQSLGVVVNSMGRVKAIAARGPNSQAVGWYAAIARWAQLATKVGEIVVEGAEIYVDTLAL